MQAAGELNRKFHRLSRTHLYRRPAGMSPVRYPEAVRCNDPVPTIVVYHHISSDADDLVECLGVRTRIETFEAHLAYYSRHYDIISQSDLLDGRLPRRPLLITFDDLYRSVLEVAGPLLRAANAPSLLFLNPSSILSRTLPFDNLLCRASAKLGCAQLMSLFSADGAAPVTRMISEHVCPLNPDRLREIRARIVRALGQTEHDLWAGTGLFLSAKDLGKLADCGIDVGNHSMNHMAFRSLSPSELDDEISGSKAALERMTGRAIRCLSIPYGNENDATPAALAVARASGHEAIFLVHGRGNHRQLAPDLFYRTSPRQVAPWLLPLTVAGLPRLRGLLRSARTHKVPPNGGAER